MKAVELREMTTEELRARVEELAEELARIKIQLALKRLDNPLQVRVTRRELARVKTVLGERLREETGGAGTAGDVPAGEAPGSEAGGK